MHGGVSEQNLIDRIHQAQQLAQRNHDNHAGLHTILFLDEANTSDAIGLVKEIMVDKRMKGGPLNFLRYGLDVIAACNPYKR